MWFRTLSYSMMFISLVTFLGCQARPKTTRWEFHWPDWMRFNTQTEKADKKVDTPLPDQFTFWKFSTAGDEKCIENVWSYLDEAIPGSKDWTIVHKNGLRVGIGQQSDWPTIKGLLEKCGTVLKGRGTIRLDGINPCAIYQTPYKANRVIFCYDIEGNFHGRDFRDSRLSLVINSAGIVGERKVRAILVPTIEYARKSQIKISSEQYKSKVEEEFENLSFTFDLGPKEFALIGPASTNQSKYLIGSHLLIGWENGSRRYYLIVIAPFTRNGNF